MTRKTVHITDATEKYIADRWDEPNWSGSINAAFNQLAFLAATEKPELSKEDWAEIYNIYAGSDLTRIVLPINLAADLLIHYGATIPSQLPENCQPLIEKLAAMSQAQQFAIIDNTRLFWAKK